TTEVGEGTTQVEKPPTEAKPPAISEVPIVQQPAVKFTPGLYTVYIGSYIIELPASEEVGRWNEAGFSAAVIHANNHFRVALGNYVSVEAAQKFADQMWEAFEYGYWIGKVE
ncbi:MAG: SPOR domain-containing protein, partial [Ignavibacteriales bacterium]|nr:SPOR domain-containing protein [Ignavibacteriales bacterium]